jgi:hypothetical protein
VIRHVIRLEVTNPIDLSPEIEQVADLLSKQSPQVRELFRYTLVLAMIDDEKARITGTRLIGCRECLAVRTIAGDVFEIARPPISDELEAELMNKVRAMVADEDDDGP